MTTFGKRLNAKIVEDGGEPLPEDIQLELVRKKYVHVRNQRIVKL